MRTQRLAATCSALGSWVLGCLLTITMSLTVACDRNIEAFQPGEEPRQPDLARIFPAPAGGVGNADSAADAQTANADSGQPVRGALPPARAESGGVPPGAAPGSEAAPAIEGVIELAREYANQRPDRAVLFVIARNAGARGGPPLAVLRIPDPSFPLEFSIGPEDVMIPTMQFAGSISLSARLDADGNAMTRGAGDISSASIEPLAPGATGISLLLNEKS